MGYTSVVTITALLILTSLWSVEGGGPSYFIPLTLPITNDNYQANGANFISFYVASVMGFLCSNSESIDLTGTSAVHICFDAHGNMVQTSGTTSLTLSGTSNIIYVPTSGNVVISTTTTGHNSSGTLYGYTDATASAITSAGTCVNTNGDAYTTGNCSAIGVNVCYTLTSNIPCLGGCGSAPLTICTMNGCPMGTTGNCSSGSSSSSSTGTGGSTSSSTGKGSSTATGTGPASTASSSGSGMPMGGSGGSGMPPKSAGVVTVAGMWVLALAGVAAVVLAT